MPVIVTLVFGVWFGGGTEGAAGMPLGRGGEAGAGR